MLDLKLLQGAIDELMEKEAYMPFYMHGIGHYLGLDTHDVGTVWLTETNTLDMEPGVVFTVEPGIYVPRDAENVPDELRGVGVRIEDDVLVTAGGRENLSMALAKEIDDIEALRREAF
jgi:Xaa-Pro aminopeptidase